jgi:pyrimidine operon attenuation protein/uracil phosphoribosyltransferase
MRIAGPDDVETLLDELADAIRPKLSPETALVGILRRGKPIADALADRLADSGYRPDVGVIGLKRYSDHLELLHDRPKIGPESLDIEIEDRHVIVVDDVLYTGESMFRATGRLRAAGATHIQTAFLCSRAGRTMPIHADFVASRLDIRPDWVIHCEIPPYEDEFAIVLAHQDALRSH